ncbi:MAG: hypothetical protein EXS10_04900 [Phycisphaerales bacterium]|nr:hypothetical protein [Phycisphaerales bacterium]
MPCAEVLFVSSLLALCVPPSTPAVEPTLDTRIDRSKITIIEPALPERGIRPCAKAELRIASDAALVPLDAATFDRARAALDRGLAFLASTQSRRGAWFEGSEVTATDMEPRARASAIAVTALGAKAFAQASRTDVARTNAYAYLQANMSTVEQRKAIEEGGLGTYVMSSVASALAMSETPEMQVELLETIAWLKAAQWDEGEGLASDTDWYGGAGYGNRKRPDLSNTQMMLDALHDAQVSSDDPTIQKALAFVARAQNFKAPSAAFNSAWVQQGAGDGGFVYSPANGGESFASEAAGEGRFGELMPANSRSLRSYGSMTYAGFKSLLYAGLSTEDPRVQAALGWIRAHWSFAENPGLGQQGYFYYLHAMARALAACGEANITDAAKVPHEWRRELIDALITRQRADGSWINDEPRWEEGKADLTTIYALLALEEALKPSRSIER